MTELEAARTAIDSVLQAHKPYPAFAVDRHWNVVLSNAALPQLYEGCSDDLMRSPVNAVRLILHPAGMGPRILNFTAWRAHTVHVLRQQIEARADPVIQGLLAEVMAATLYRPDPTRRKGWKRRSGWQRRCASQRASATCLFSTPRRFSARPTT